MAWFQVSPCGTVNKAMSQFNVNQRLAELLQTAPSLSRLMALGFAAVVSAALLLLFAPSLSNIEERVGALGWTLNPDATLEERITLVVVDEASIAEIGPWPWAREDMAALVTAIDEAGAQLQLHDITYPEARSGDAAFITALESANGAVMAQVPALQQQVLSSSTGQLTHSLQGVSCGAASGGPQFWSASSYVASAAVFANIPKGHNAAIIDSDGAVRRSPAAVCVDGAAYPALSITAFLQLGSSNEWRGDMQPGTGFLAPDYVLTLDGYPGLDIPLDENGAMRVSFAKSPESFRAVSAADVMRGRVDPVLLENAWVIVGGTAFGMADIVPTPYSGAAFGIELQARLLASLLDVDVPYTPASSAYLMLLLCAVFAGLLYGLASYTERFTAYSLPIAALVLPILAAAIHIYALGAANLWLGWLSPALFGATAASALLLLELARVRIERTRVFTNLNSYLPNEVAREIAFSLPSSSVNAQRRNVTLLNADLRNFSAFGEARAPEEIAALLHYFFTRSTEIVESFGGHVHEFKGDGILAIWDEADASTATRALSAAKALQEALNDTLLPEHALKGLEPLALGVGIEQGPVLIGSIGPAHRRTHTLLGDTVSITLRIQEMTAELAQPILIGECAARQLSDEKLQSQGSYLLSGLRIPHTLFAPQPLASVTKLSSTQPQLTVVSGQRG